MIITSLIFASDMAFPLVSSSTGTRGHAATCSTLQPICVAVDSVLFASAILFDIGVQNPPQATGMLRRANSLTEPISKIKDVALHRVCTASTCLRVRTDRRGSVRPSQQGCCQEEDLGAQCAVDANHDLQPLLHRVQFEERLAAPGNRGSLIDHDTGRLVLLKMHH